MAKGNGRQKQERDSLAVICRNSIKTNKLLAAGGTTGSASLAEQQAQTALLTTMDTNIADIEAALAKSNLETLKGADDLVQTFAYLDAGTADERVSTIIYSSVLDAITPDVTKTFVYAGSAGAYRVSTITLS